MRFAVVVLLIGSCLGIRATLSPGVAAALRLTQATSKPANAAASEAAWLLRVKRWCEAVATHEPGQADAAAVAIAPWSEAELQSVVRDVLALREALNKADTSHASSPRTVEHADWAGSIEEAERLLAIRRDQAQRDHLNSLLKRGALLHTDIELLLPADASVARSGSQPRFIVAVDGRTQDGALPVHIQVARMLLDGVSPNPSADPAVRLWYLATAAHQLQSWQLAQAGPQLERARRLFPASPDVLFDSACLQEMLASARVQSTVRSAPRNLAFPSVASPEKHLDHAHSLLRDAARRDPGRALIREHLGRVTGLLGRHQEAVRILRDVTPKENEPLLMFFRDMFLGDEEQALGHRAAARECYERAAAAYPSAQSPRLALAQLARRYGDGAEGLASLRAMFRLNADDPAPYDPWFDYYTAPFFDAPALFRQWWRVAGQAGERQ